MAGSSAWSYWTDYLPLELGSSKGEIHMVAAPEAFRMWPNPTARCPVVPNDSVQSPQGVPCALPRPVSRPHVDAPHPIGYSYYWSNSCFSPEAKLDTKGQFSPRLNRDYCFKLDESLNAPLSKAAGLGSLVAVSNSLLKSDPDLNGATSDSKTAECELEWQFMFALEPNSSLANPISELCKKDEDPTFEEAVWCDTKPEGTERVQQVHPSQFGAFDTMINRNDNDGQHDSHCGAFLSEQPLFAPKFGAAFPGISEQQDKSLMSSIESSSFWQIADKEAFAGHFVQRIVEHLESSNLPCSQEGFNSNATTSFDSSPSLLKEKEMLQYRERHHNNSLTPNESRDLVNLSLRTSSPTLSCFDPPPAEAWHYPWQSEALRIPAAKGIPTRTGDSNTDSQLDVRRPIMKDQGAKLFAEALCHSQTRAREAEKKVQGAFEEKELFMHLFFKEAYLAFTYKQWIASLQSENMWLRMSPRYQPMTWLQQQQQCVCPFLALERMSTRHLRSFRQDHPAGHHMDHNLPSVWNEKALVCLRNDVVMGYTLAFAVGVSLAGAGLVLGWSRGWTLLTH